MTCGHSTAPMSFVRLFVYTDSNDAVLRFRRVVCPHIPRAQAHDTRITQERGSRERRNGCDDATPVERGRFWSAHGPKLAKNFAQQNLAKLDVTEIGCVSPCLQEDSHSSEHRLVPTHEPLHTLAKSSTKTRLGAKCKMAIGK